MNKLEEIELAFGILKKYGLPISPILANAIQEECEETIGGEDMDNTIIVSKEKLIDRVTNAIRPIIRICDSKITLVIDYEPGNGVVVYDSVTSIQSQKQNRCNREDSIIKSKSPENCSESVGLLKAKFEKYLLNSKSIGTARCYLSSLDSSIRRYICRFVDNSADSIYSFTTIDAVKACISKLKSNEEFLDENTRRHNGLTAALNSYLRFIEKISTIDSTC